MCLLVIVNTHLHDGNVKYLSDEWLMPLLHVFPRSLFHFMPIYQLISTLWHNVIYLVEL